MVTDGLILSDRRFDGRRFLDEPAAIELRGGRIAEIHRGEGPAGRPTVYDARGRTLLPGLIDAHAHVARTGLFEPVEPPNLSAIAHNLRMLLDAGVTTVGDMGGPAPLSMALSKVGEAFPHAGPAVRAAGPILADPAGYPLDWMPRRHAALGVVLTCATEREARASVQRVAEAGMSHVKLAIMHAGYDLKPLSVFSRSTATAIVDEAHRLGLRALAHAHWAADYRLALDAGVDALMHSSFDPLDDELVRRVADAGVPVCPTLWVFHSACLGAAERWDLDASRGVGVLGPVRRSWRRFAEAWAASGDLVPRGIAGGAPKAKAEEGVRNALSNLRLLHDAGVPLSYGSDGPFGFSVLGRVTDELSLLASAGLTTTECLSAATAGSAAILGCDDRGTIEPGRRADLVVIDGDPREDLGAVGRVEAVFRGGERVDPQRGRGARARAVAEGVGSTVLDAARRWAGLV